MEVTSHLLFLFLLCFVRKLTAETFRGSEFISVSNQTHVVSSSEHITLQFKTRDPNGLLYYSGNQRGDYLKLSTKDGGVSMTIKLGTSVIERQVRPNRVRFDDNRWHQVTADRKVREFSITVDGIFGERGSVTGPFGLFTTTILFVGGSDHSISHSGSSVAGNFIGCIRGVELIADGTSVLHVVNTSNLIEAHGANFSWSCQEAITLEPVTFTNSESFVALPKWEAAKIGALTLQIRTNEAIGVIAFSSGARNEEDQTTDFFAMELLNGHVFLSMDMGSGPVKVKATTKRVDDGNWHTISLRRTGKSGRVTVDESAVDFICPGVSSQLDLEGPFFIGGIGTDSDLRPYHKLPPQLWAGSLGFGFVGCLKDLIINDEAVDVAIQAQQQDSAGVKSGCHPSSNNCGTAACLNGGYCSEGWNRFICSCHRTPFTGPTCAKDATTLNFNGNQFFKLYLPEESVTQAEDLYLRFRTSKPAGLMLAATAKDKNMNHLLITLEASSIKVILNMGEGNKVARIGFGLNDDLWHNLKIERRGPSLEVRLDGETQVTEITGQLITLEVDRIYLGALDKSQIHSSSSLYHSTRDVPNFSGSLQQLIFNGHHFLEMAKKGQMTGYNASADFEAGTPSITHAVTFKSRNTYVGLPQLKAFSKMNIDFWFKTTTAHGLLLYNRGRGSDFVAVEMEKGQIHYSFNLGDGARRLSSSSRIQLNDNKWHSVSISRSRRNQHTLMVDDHLASVTPSGTNIHLDLEGLLYMGGVPHDFYSSLPKLVSSKTGFMGCIASLELTGEIFTLTASDVLIPSTLVEEGCSSLELGCPHSTACTQPGICVRNWDKYSCDCDTTIEDFGCPEEAAAFRFGPPGGIITYTFPANKSLDSKIDNIHFGIMTTQKDAVLIRVDSASSNDYVELQLMDGAILVVYNLGVEDHEISELSVKINDNRYHTVKFTRNGPNATLQVDHHNIQRKNPNGKQLTIFNTLHRVQMGGKKNSMKEIEKYFDGVLTGLVFNGEKMLQLAADSDPRLSVEGRSELLLSLPGLQFPKHHLRRVNTSRLHQMQQHSKGLVSVAGDDLILSLDHNGCWEDQDCSSHLHPGLTDDLITPFVSPPPFSSTGKPPVFPSRKECNGDDEDDDCIEYSGDGEVPHQKYHIPSSTKDVTSTTSTTTSRTPVTFHFWPSPATTPKTTTEDNSIMYTSKPIPPETSREPFEQTYRPRVTPSRPTGRPAIIEVPKPMKPSMPREKAPTTIASYTASSADRTATLIGLVAVILIITIFLAPLFLYVRIKYRESLVASGHVLLDVSGGNKNYQFVQHPSAPIPAGVAYHPAGTLPPVMNRQSGMGGVAAQVTMTQPLPVLTTKKKRNSKEWYV